MKKEDELICACSQPEKRGRVDKQLVKRDKKDAFNLALLFSYLGILIAAGLFSAAMFNALRSHLNIYPKIQESVIFIFGGISLLLSCASIALSSVFYKKKSYPLSTLIVSVVSFVISAIAVASVIIFS